jgi:hypothetical protein
VLNDAPMAKTYAASYLFRAFIGVLFHRSMSDVKIPTMHRAPSTMNTIPAAWIMSAGVA